MKYLVLIFPIIAVLISCSKQSESTKILTDVYAIDDGEHILARQTYEQERIVNPVTQLVPDNIQAKEFAFVQNMGMPKSSTNLSWQLKGPINVGGRTRALAIDVNDEMRILCGGVSGGLWISEDGGESFFKATTNLMLHSVTSIAQDPRPGFQNIWYYGTGELSGNSADLPGHGIYTSTDNGLTWTLLQTTFNENANAISNLGDFRYIQDVKVNPMNGHVIAATFAGIFLSADYGDSWQNVLVADGSPNGFNYLNFGNQTSVDVNASGVYIASLSVDAQNKGIWRSLDALNWTDITPQGFSSAYRRIECAFNPSNLNETMFIVDATTNPSVDNHELWHYVYVSGDGSGVNGIWEERSSNLPDGDCLGFYDFNFGYFQSQNSYDLLIAYHPSIEDLVFIGGTNLYRSTDAFQSNTNYDWIGGYQCDEQSPSNYIWPNHHPDNHNLAFLPSNPQAMVSSHDGGLSKTLNLSDNNIVWESMNKGYGTSQFYTVAIEQGNTSSEFIMGGLQDNGTWHTTSANPNQDWLPTFYGDGAFCAIAENRESYYVSWQGGKTFKFDIDDNGTVNGLTRIDPIGATNYRFINPFILDPDNSNTMYLLGGTYIWVNKSLDAIPLINDEYNAISQGWERINESNTNTLFSTSNYITALGMSKANNDVLYYGTFNGQIYKLSGLQTGTLVKDIIKRGNMPSGAYVSCIDVNPNDENEILLSYSNYEVKSIYHSSDGGDVWTNISGTLEQNPDGSGAGPSVNWMHFYQDNIDTFYFAATTSGLFVTEELQGENTVWQREAINEIGNVPVAMITSRVFDRNIVVATHGGGIYATKVVNVDIQNHVNAQVISLGFPSPNPSKGKTSLKFTINESKQLNIAVYNLLGVKVHDIEKSSFSAGKHEVKWDTGGYSNGIYLIVVNDGKQIAQRRLLVAD
jgi:hypothetical protein